MAFTGGVILAAGNFGLEKMEIVDAMDFCLGSHIYDFVVIWPGWFGNFAEKMV